MLPVSRREARERALSLLYEAETKDKGPAEVLDELPVAPDSFAVEIVKGVGARAQQIDALISEHAIDWALERMPAIDRAVLRMATYELLAHHDVPTGVVLSEAVELAGSYSTDDSGRFVNGVLSQIAKRVRPAGGAGSSA